MFHKQILNAYAGMTPGYRKLADFITERPLDAAFLNAPQIAERLEMEPATVEAFAHELEYASYEALSEAVKDHLRDTVKAQLGSIEAHGGDKALIRKLAGTALENLQNFVATQTEQLARALHILHTAEHIWMIAELTFHKQAAFLGQSLEFLGIPCTVIQPSLLVAGSALERMQPSHAVLGFGFGSPGLDVGYLIRLAREKGLSTVALTSSDRAPLAQEAELCLFIPTLGNNNMPSFSTAVMIIYFLFDLLAAKRPEETVTAFVEYQDALGKLVQLRAETSVKEIEIPTPLS